MNIPAPLPDELDLGLLGRIQKLHEYASEKETLDTLNSVFGAEELDAIPRPVLLANATRMTLAQFVTQHTLAPFYFGFTARDKQHTHAERANSYLRDWYGRRRPIIEAFFCDQCVEEDHRTLGITYWRRSHHLPGVTWCAVHKRGLLVASQLHPYTEMPEAYVRRARKVTVNKTADIWNNPIVSGYGNVCIDLLQREVPFNVYEIENMICVKVKEFGLYAGKKGGSRRPMLNDLASSILPQEWLIQNFSTPYQNGPRSYVGPLNCTLGHIGKSDVVHYALAMAIIATPEAAIAARQLSTMSRTKNT